MADLDLSDVGALSVDSIAGDNDANTSITFSGSDVITIATGGSGRLTIGDGALSPITDNQIDLGTGSLEFKDAYFDGTVETDNLTIGGAQGSDGQVLTSTGSGVGWEGVGTSWQAVVTSATTMVSGRGYFVNTTSAAITMTLPASPSIGDFIQIIDYAGTADTYNITVARNSEKIQGDSANLTVSTERAAFTLVYVDSTQGWLLTEK
jgi:hypothetical protein